MLPRKFIASLILLVPLLALGQTAATVTTPQELQSQIQELRLRANSAGGAASIQLATYANHITMLAFRTRTGAAEVHVRFADVFVVLEGHAKLISGGMLADPVHEESDEPRGSSVKNGLERSVGPGDILHIPAGVPHQLLIAKGDELAYYVIKVREK